MKNVNGEMNMNNNIQDLSSNKCKINNINNIKIKLQE